MSRRVLALNVLLGLLGALCAAGLIRELLVPLPLRPPPMPRAAAPAAIPASTPATPAGSYGPVVSRNLFSPSRSEALAGPVVAAGPKPLLHGVVMDGPKSRAYLEDPTVKRTFGYAVGDTVSGGRVQSISQDRVVIARSDGLVEVLLQDPAKPVAVTPAAGPAMATPPAVPATPGTPASRAPAAANVPTRANER